MVSKTSDCRVTQVVDIKKGVHCMTSKRRSPSRSPKRDRRRDTPQYLVTYAADADMNKAMDDASWAMIELAAEGQRVVAIRCPMRSRA